MPLHPWTRSQQIPSFLLQIFTRSYSSLSLEQSYPWYSQGWLAGNLLICFFLKCHDSTTLSYVSFPSHSAAHYTILLSSWRLLLSENIYMFIYLLIVWFTLMDHEVWNIGDFLSLVCISSSYSGTWHTGVPRKGPLCSGSIHSKGKRIQI